MRWLTSPWLRPTGSRLRSWCSHQVCGSLQFAILRMFANQCRRHVCVSQMVKGLVLFASQRIGLADYSLID
jgi:hypothetical protein